MAAFKRTDNLGGALYTSHRSGARNLAADFEGNLSVVGNGGATSVLGSTLSASVAFPSDVIHNDIVVASTTGGGSATASSGVAQVAIGTSSGDSAQLESHETGRSGAITNTAVFDAAFDGNAVAGSVQIAGTQCPCSALGFGYNGASFGILYSGGGTPHVVVLTVSTAANAGANATVTLDNQAFTVALTDASADLDFTAYEIGAATYSGWSVTSYDTSVVFRRLTAGPDTGGGTYSFAAGGTGAAASFAAPLNAGTSRTDQWFTQSVWNIDVCDGTGLSGLNLDPTIGNVYSIHSQLGYGVITWSIQNPTSGKLVPVHMLRPTTLTKNLTGVAHKLHWSVTSTSSTTALTLRATRGSLYTNAVNSEGNPLYAASSTTSVGGGTETVVLSIRKRPVVNGRPNAINAHPRHTAVAVSGNNPAIVRYYKNAVIGAGTTADYANWSAHDAQSGVDVADAAQVTTITNGRLLTAIAVSKSDKFVSDILFKHAAVLHDNETLTITVQSSTATVALATLTWSEDR